MLSNLKEQLKDLITESLNESFEIPPKSPPVEVEVPNDKQHGEFSCNIALKLAKTMRKAPVDIASEFAEVISQGIGESVLKDKIEKVDVKKPGFINFYLTRLALYDVLKQVFKEKENYGRSDAVAKQKIQIEFVSANPTGPLSIAHARQAAVGDALGNILQMVGLDIKKEFYVNDEGNQINLLGQSISLRAQEILGEKVDFPEEGYQGEYIKDMAQIYIDKNKIKKADQLKGKESELIDFGVKYLLDVIKKDLDDFGVHFDVWSHQSKIADADSIQSILDFLGEKGFLYEKDGALWFKSTDFGDDKDRVVEKSDGTYTYLTPDIVYHRDKFNRGFEKVINIWGPDHHGYIPRIKASVEALGHDRDDVEVLIVQLATIYRDGKPISMSTRRGQYISLREVIDEVGSDAARFFFLMRHINVHLDFDLELAKKETPENPVYYIQYAHARINSIMKKAKEEKLKGEYSDFSGLKEVEEIDLIKRMGQFPDMLLVCYYQLDPYALVNYLQELAMEFHKFYDKHKVVGENRELSATRLALIEAVKIVLANGLRLLGVSVPDRM